MKKNDKARKASAEIPLAREEWDFSRCLEGRELLCLGYEYARESEWVIGLFRKAQEDDLDEFGVWNHLVEVEFPETMSDDEFWKFLDEVGLAEKYDWDFPPAIELSLLPGFPDTPFLKCEFDFKGWARSNAGYWDDQIGEELGSGALEVVPRREAKKGLDANCHCFRIDWSSSDRVILNDFREWLRKCRPEAAFDRRGQSPERGAAADLKALGAYRLLKHFTAEQALAYTQRFMPNGLYVKIPDWYAARRRARQILRAFFKVETPGS
jgi:hypothetical protein